MSVHSPDDDRCRLNSFCNQTTRKTCLFLIRHQLLSVFQLLSFGVLIRQNISTWLNSIKLFFGQQIMFRLVDSSAL